MRYYKYVQRFFRKIKSDETFSDSSPWDTLLFSYTTKVVWLGNIAESLDIGDLPIVPTNMRATYNYSKMKKTIRDVKLRIFSWSPKPGSGWLLAYRLLRLNHVAFTAELLLAAVSAVLFYAPPLFLQKLVAFLEVDPLRENKGWGWVFVIGLFAANALSFLGEKLEFFCSDNSMLTKCSYGTVMVVVHNYDPSPPQNPTKLNSVCEDSCAEICCIQCTSPTSNRRSNGSK